MLDAYIIKQLQIKKEEFCVSDILEHLREFSQTFNTRIWMHVGQDYIVCFPFIIHVHVCICKTMCSVKLLLNY